MENVCLIFNNGSMKDIQISKIDTIVCSGGDNPICVQLKNGGDYFCKIVTFE